MANSTETEEEVGKKAVAKKEYIDATGKAVPISQATGMRYTSLADNKTYTYQIEDESIKSMFAAFGVSTLMTNTSSQNRNGPNAGEYDSDVDAIAERFARVHPGDWGVLRGGGPGRGIDVELLFEALHDVKPQVGDAQKQKLTDDADFRKLIRNHPDVAPGYEAKLRARRAPVDAKPLDDLLA